MRKHTLEYMQEVAGLRDGKCLSSEYINLVSELQWECSEGHVFKQLPAKVIHRNSWCPVCNINVGEELCRTIFEHIFKEKFISCKPQWLLSSSGNFLEFDGYCQRLNMAFEYQGIQHYEEKKFFHRTKTAFQDLQLRDQEKRLLAKERGVQLIEIPYFKDGIKISEMTEHVVRILKKSGVQVPYFDNDICFGTAFSQKKWEELNEIIVSKGGKLLTDVYITDKTKMLVECDKNHQWLTFPYSLRSGRWCKKCAKQPVIDLVAKRFGALSVKAKFKGEKYKGRQLQWRCICDCGNEYIATGSLLHRGIETSCGCAVKPDLVTDVLGVEDLTGKRFGRLVVMKISRGNRGKKNYWECRCDCGEKKSIDGYALLNGSTKSCGCIYKEYHQDRMIQIEVGERYGQLTVVNFDKNASEYFWNCKCDCGEMTSVSSSDLKSGHTQSCGCLRNKRMLVNLEGQRFGTYTVIKKQIANSGWLIRCDCGQETDAESEDLGKRVCQFCKPDPKCDPIRGAWKRMKESSYNPSSFRYKSAGANGIGISEEWMEFSNFKRDMLPTYLKGLVLFRKDRKKDFSRDNCRWATRKELNSHSKNNVLVETLQGVLTVVEAAELVNKVVA